VLKRNRLFVESPEKAILASLLEHPDIAAAHDAVGGGGIQTGSGRRDVAAAAMASTLEKLDLTRTATNDGPSEDEEAAEAERAACREPVAGTVGGEVGVSQTASALSPLECSRTLPLVEASAIGSVSDAVEEMFMFEIAASRVRALPCDAPACLEPASLAARNDCALCPIISGTSAHGVRAASRQGPPPCRLNM
jgi:hypothetical protein